MLKASTITERKEYNFEDRDHTFYWRVIWERFLKPDEDWKTGASVPYCITVWERHADGLKLLGEEITVYRRPSVLYSRKLIQHL